VGGWPSTGVEIVKPRVRRFVLAAVPAALAVLTLGVYGALFTDLGILVVGHHYWMSRAARSPDDASLTENLERVLDSTQYGVNNAENWVLGAEDRATGLRLWAKLIELAPNDLWRGYYGERLAAEAPDAGEADARPAVE
jgi:hypothetical protein